MKKHARAKSTGQSLIAQGEPMVWLTGGMFAIACSMIIALLALILVKGLSSHWQRPFAIYPLLNGEFEAGELQYQQPFNISRQSLGHLDEKSRAKAEEVLAGRDQAESTQLYLRTGNYDVSNRHFAFVPTVTMSSSPADLENGRWFRPNDVWLLERREWGVLFGFPCRLEQTFTPQSDENYASLKVLLDNFPGLAEGAEGSASWSEGFASELNASLIAATGELRNTWEKGLAGGKSSSDTIHTTTDATALKSAVENSQFKQSLLIGKIESAKQRLGRLDRQLSSSRVGVRKAELRDQTDLQSIADEATQLATAKSISEAMGADLMASIQAWKKRLQSPSERQSQLGSLELAAKKKLEIEQTDFAPSLADLKTRMSAMPYASKRALEAVLQVAESVTRTQYTLNLEIARLEAGLQSEVLTVQVPTLDWVGEVPLDSDASKGSKVLFTTSQMTLEPELAKLVGLETSEGVDLLVGDRTNLSATQSLLAMNSPLGWKRVWLAENADKKSTRVASLREKTVSVSDIVRLVEPNQLGLFGKIRLYIIRWLEFLFGQPREGGIEGGFFPALWGTIVMTLIMSIAVMPFGVIAALYMREYAKSGWVLSVIRISINNLAGVPSIVYGVFGLSFFCYTIGGYIDGGPIKAGFTPWPSSLWFIALTVTAFAGTGAFFLAALASGSPAQMSPFRKRLASFGGLFWLMCLIGLVCLVVKSPFFNGFYQAALPNPTYGKGCLLWASCTLALLTLPVVIVATEEALAAVPNSIREGSYACGAGKWQTLQRIVLPYARPGIITGFILAMARGAGEVAPMMLVGAIPLVTELPLDFDFPFFHGSRSFMHLGFQIYSLGFQSQNSEAAKPMVFTATLLLLTIVTLLNVTAIWLRARLRKRFQGSQF
jgi:phosphate transport system permease protein